MGDPSETSRVPPPPHRSFRGVPPIAMLAAAVLATFWPAILNGFVWDDIPFIIRNAFLHDLGNLPKFLVSGDAAGTGGMNPYYRPLTTATFALDYALWGRQPAGYHATNILLHLGATIALYFAARRATRHDAAALAAALLFAVHPVHAEPVGYISARADLLCAIFMLTSFLAYSRHDVSGRRADLLLSLLLFALGLLSKIVALILIPLLLLHLALFRREEIRWKSLVPFLAVSLAFLAARSWILKLESWGADPWPDRMAMAGINLVVYLKNALLPLDLKVFYALPGPSGFREPAAAVSWLFLAILGVALLRVARSRPAVAFGTGWFFATLFPVIGIVMTILPSPIADRYLYIPLVGLAIAAAGLIDSYAYSPRFPRGRMAVFPVVAACILACSVRTAGRIGLWRDPVTFWRTAASEAPRNPYVLVSYGSSLRVAGRLPEAEATLNEAIALDDRYAHPHIQLTLLEFTRGNLKEAERHTLMALQREPNNPIALMHLGVIKAEKGWTEEAVILLREAIRLNPHYSDAKINLETLLNRTRSGQG